MRKNTWDRLKIADNVIFWRPYVASRKNGGIRIKSREIAQVVNLHFDDGTISGAAVRLSNRIIVHIKRPAFNARPLIGIISDEKIDAYRLKKLQSSSTERLYHLPYSLSYDTPNDDCRI